MTPSKENCVRAMSALDRVKTRLSGPADPNLVELQFVADFLASAAKRLPREESLKKDRERKRAQTKYPLK